MRIVEATANAMFRSAVSLDADVVGGELTRALTGVTIERPLADVVGRGATATLTRTAIDAEAHIVERNGAKIVVEVLSEARAKTLGRLLTRLGTRVAASAALSFVPILGPIVMVALDVYFVVDTILGVAEILGYNVWGDPHLVTLDGRIYDLQSAGEFVLAQSANGRATVQGRFAPISPDVSVMKAVTLGAGEDRFELSSSGALLNGQPLTLDGMTVTEGGLAVAHLDGRWLAKAPDGATLVGSSTGNVRVVAPEGLALRGLLGNNDGDADNDLAFPDGTPLTSTRPADLHGSFADAWRVTPETSVFTYAAGQSTATFTDRAFPANIVTLGDFAPAQLDAANASCIAGGVSVGATMDACVLDLLVTSDRSFLTAAAATTTVVDPAATTFGADGVLSQSFDGAIPAALQSKTTLKVSNTSWAAGPFFDDSPYRFAFTSVPRHDTATMTARVLLLGSSDPSNRRVSVNADGVSAATFTLEGAGHLDSGPPGSSVTPDGSGTSPSGTAYTAYKVTLPVKHFGDALKVEILPQNIHAVLGSGVAVDTLEIRLAAPPADTANGLTLPFTASTALGQGLGQLETAAAADEYHFTVPAGAPAPDVLIETSRAPNVRTEILNDTTGAVVDPTEQNNYRLYRALPAGAYQLTVTGNAGYTGPYELPVLIPAPQTFVYQVGQHVEPGKIAGAPVEGAGNLETTASKDVYPFTVPAGGQEITIDSDGYSPVFYNGSKLVNVAGGAVLLDGLYGHHVITLAAGDYRFVVENPGSTGTYGFTTRVVPDPGTYTLLNTGEELHVGDTRQSPDGGHVLRMQADGNLLLTNRAGSTVWSTNHHGGTCSVIVQTDSNFVQYCDGGAVWASGTNGRPGPAALRIQNDGDLVLATSSQVLWSSGTAGQ